MDENYQSYLKEDLEKYEDKWIVIVDKKIVASGDNLKELVDKVKKEHGTKVVPFVAKVPKKTLMILSNV
jgi:orotate phosphoribosyltransferase-like protein